MLPGLSPALAAAMMDFDPLFVGLLEIALPGYTLRLCDGASEVDWGGGTFRGFDPLFGSWVSCDAFGDGIGDEVPAMSVQLLPTDGATAGDLTAPQFQGSPLRIWLAVIDKATGGVVPDPIQLFDGILDQPSIEVGKRSLTLDYDAVSALEPLFLDDEGIRLSDAHHQDVWPGERGLEYMSGLVRTIIWGPGDRPAGISYGSSFNSGGGSGWADFAMSQEF